MKKIIGVDEAGRGPLAGRVYASAVILNPDKKIDGLKDSKKLTAKQRETLYSKIISNAISYSINYAEVDEIDSINILQATFLAMQRAVDNIYSDFDFICVDGRDYPFDSKYPGEAIVNGDNIKTEIMAASILAKVERDRYMIRMHNLYPEYNFIKHKGYPTKEHKEKIKKYGPSKIHRKTFKGVKEYL